MVPVIQQTGKPEQDAIQLRRTVKGGTAPYDPVRIAKALGMDVFVGGVPVDTAGMLVKRYGEDAAIYLNPDDSRNRQRFTCAHEIGHYVRRSEFSEDWSAIDKRNYASSTGLDPEERYANQFAAALLMPADDVRMLRKQGWSIAQLAAHFEVSSESMRYRVGNLHA